MEQKKLTRRRFLQVSAGLGAMAALSGCASSKLQTAGAPAVEAGEVEVRHAWCQMCGPCRTGCSTLCYIKDGRWVNVEGNPNAGNNAGQGSNTLCAKGNAAIQTIYDPTRIMYPMKRVGKKGEGKFERCTYEEAIKMLADKLTQVKKDYGAQAYGMLSPQFTAFISQLGRRFLNVYGSPNYMHSAICAYQRTVSAKISIGSAATNPGQMNKTKLLINWGANPENSAVNQGGSVSRINNMEKGMKVVDIRPMMDALASKADIWMPIRPGTDTALGLALLNVIIGENLYDKDFVENWCDGFQELSEHVKQFTPAWAANITGLEESQIIEVARMMGTTKPMAILYGNGIGDQQSDGNWAVVCACLIEAITGNLAIAGGGGAAMVAPASLIKLKAIPTLTDMLPETEEDRANGYYAGVSNLVAPEVPKWYINPKTWESGPSTAYFRGLMSILTEEPYPLRVVIGQSSNPFGATRQPKKIAQALEKLEFYAVMDTHWNSSCDYADIVIPAAYQYEISHQMGVKNSVKGTFIGMNKIVDAPMGEAVSDWQFWLDLGVAMGYGEHFWNGDMDECLREQLDGTGITLEELREAPCGLFVERTDGAKATEPPYQNYEKLFADLPNGKVQCYNNVIGGKPNNTETGTLPYLPTYIGAPESPANTPELLDEYPIIMSDVHAYRLCQHSYYSSIPYLRELQPYPWAKINPATAKKYGIADGDWMKIESPHGWIKLVARYFEGISPETIMARRGWWQECPDLNLPGYGCMDGGSDSSLLYDSEISNFDPFHSAMAKQTLVKISKYEGDK